MSRLQHPYQEFRACPLPPLEKVLLEGKGPPPGALPIPTPARKVPNDAFGKRPRRSTQPLGRKRCPDRGAVRSVGGEAHSAVHQGPSSRVCHQFGESPGDLGSADKESFTHLKPHLSASRTQGPCGAPRPCRQRARLTPAAPTAELRPQDGAGCCCSPLPGGRLWNWLRTLEHRQPPASVAHPPKGRHGADAGTRLWQ